MSSSDLAFEASTLLIGTSHRGQTEWTSASFTPQNTTEQWLLAHLIKPFQGYMSAPVFVKRSLAINRTLGDDMGGHVMRRKLVRRSFLDGDLHAWLWARYFAILRCTGLQRLPSGQENALLGYTNCVTGKRHLGFAAAFIAASADPDELERLVVTADNGAPIIGIDPYTGLLEGLDWPKGDKICKDVQDGFRRLMRRDLGWVGPVVCNA